MRVAVVGATGRIGSLTVAELEHGGHDPVPISRSHGVDVATGAGLDDALAGVDAVIDASSTMAADEAGSVAFFSTSTRNLLEAEARAGVGHHVVLSIVNVDRVAGNGHYAGKRAQEATVVAGSVPWTIVRATQFHDFAEMVAGWTERDGVVRVAPLLLQPIAPADVAAILARVATDAPQHRHLDVAGPETHDMVDMARRTLAARGRDLRIVASWTDAVFDPSMAGEVLLPGPDAELAPTSFDDWLATLTPAVV